MSLAAAAVWWSRRQACRAGPRQPPGGRSRMDTFLGLCRWVERRSLLQTDAVNVEPTPMPGMRRTAYPTYLFRGHWQTIYAVLVLA